MRFHKYQAIGNDYLVLDTDGTGTLSPAFVQRVCDRHFGLGADGILVKGDAGGLSVRIYNPDGSEAEKSGNGLRIFARYLYLLQSLVREAIQLGADAVEVEYRDRFDEIVAYLGPLGQVLARLPGNSPDAVALQRSLHVWKARPRRIRVGGESRIIRTEVWDSFGEDAFRLSLK
jgi:diaminopimelate epimerase